MRAAISSLLLLALAILALSIASTSASAQLTGGEEEEEEAEVVEQQQLLASQQQQQVAGGATTAEKAEALLNEIVRYGIDRSEELSEVEERELYDRGVRLTKANPAHFVGIFNKQKERGRELAKYAYAALEASSLLAKQ